MKSPIIRVLDRTNVSGTYSLSVVSMCDSEQHIDIWGSFRTSNLEL